MTFEHIDRMVREANPVPDPAAPGFDVAVLPERDWRTNMSSDLDLGLVVEEKVPEPRKRRAWRATAALVAGAAVVAAVFQVGLPGTNGVADDPGQALVEMVMEAMAGADGDALLAILSDDAFVDISPAHRAADLPLLGQFWNAIGTSVTFDTCELRGEPGPEASRLGVCDVTLENAWSRALGVDPVSTRAYIKVEGAEVTEAQLRFPERFQNETFRRFIDWRNEHHPGARAIMHNPDGTARLSEASIELWGRYTDEFVSDRTDG